jgi:hypothetical protein
MELKDGIIILINLAILGTVIAAAVYVFQIGNKDRSVSCGAIDMFRNKEKFGSSQPPAPRSTRRTSRPAPRISRRTSRPAPRTSRRTSRPAPGSTRSNDPCSRFVDEMINTKYTVGCRVDARDETDVGTCSREATISDLNAKLTPDNDTDWPIFAAACPFIAHNSAPGTIGSTLVDKYVCDNTMKRKEGHFQDTVQRLRNASVIPSDYDSGETRQNLVDICLQRSWFGEDIDLNARPSVDSAFDTLTWTQCNPAQVWGFRGTNDDARLDYVGGKIDAVFRAPGETDDVMAPGPNLCMPTTFANPGSNDAGSDWQFRCTSNSDPSNNDVFCPDQPISNEVVEGDGMVANCSSYGRTCLFDKDTQQCMQVVDGSLNAGSPYIPQWQ